MQIILTEEEIVEAIETHVRAQISINDDQEISVDLKAGRGDNGFSATLDIRAPKPKTGNKKPVTRTRSTTPEPTEAPTQAPAAVTKPTTAAPVRGISDTPEDRQPDPAPETILEPTVETHIAARVAEETEAVPEPAATAQPKAVKNKGPSLFGAKTTTVVPDEVPDAELAPDEPAAFGIEDMGEVLEAEKKAAAALPSSKKPSIFSFPPGDAA